MIGTMKEMIVIIIKKIKVNITLKIIIKKIKKLNHVLNQKKEIIIIKKILL